MTTSYFNATILCTVCNTGLLKQKSRHTTRGAASPTPRFINATVPLSS